MKKPIFALSIFALVLVLTGCGKTAEVTKTSKDVDFYTYATDDSSKPTGKMTLHFFNGVEDVPYISMDEIMSFYASASEDDSTFKMTGSYSGKTYTMMRENGGYATFDYKEETLFFHNYEAFVSKG